MGLISVSVEIDAPPTAVWTVIEPIERHVDWMTDARAIRFDNDQTRGVGTRFVCDTKVGPITLADQMEITDWAPPNRMGVRHSGIVTGVGAFELEAIDRGRRTRFTWDEELRFPWYLAGRLGETIGDPLVIKPIWRRNLRHLKNQIELLQVPARHQR